MLIIELLTAGGTREYWVF